jgi:hypothetical protein
MIGRVGTFLRERVPRSRRDGPIRWWSFLVLAAGLVLIALAADLASASTQRDWSHPLTANSVKPSRSTIEGSLDLRIEVHGRTIRASYTLRVPRESLVATELELGQYADGSLANYLGAVRLGTAELAFQPPAVTVAAGDSYATVVTGTAWTRLPSTATRVSITPAITDHRYLPPVVVTVATDDARLFADRVPSESSPTSTKFTNVDDPIVLTIVAGTSAESAVPPGRAAPPNKAASAFWDKEFQADADAPVGTAQLIVTVAGQRLSCSYRLSFPTDDALAFDDQTLRTAFQDHLIGGDQLAGLVGAVELDGHRLEFGDPAILPVTDDSTVKIRIDSTSAALQQQTSQIDILPAQRAGVMPPLDVTIRTSGSEILEPSRPVTAMTAGQATFQRVSGRITLSVRVTGFGPKAVPKSQPNALHTWNTAHVRGFSIAAFWACVAAPVAFFLWLRSRRRLGAVADRPHRISAIILWCFLALAVTGALADVVSRWSPATSIVDTLYRNRLWPGGRADARQTTVDLAIMLGLGVMWPAYAWQQRPASRQADPAAASTGWLRSLGGDLVAAVLVILGTLAISDAAGVSGAGSWPNRIVFGLTGLVIAGLVWATVAVLRLPVPRVLRELSVALILGWAVLQRANFTARTSDPAGVRWSEYLIVIAIGFTLIMTTALLGLAVAQLHLEQQPPTDSHSAIAKLAGSVRSFDQPSVPLWRLIREHPRLSTATAVVAALLAVPTWTFTGFRPGYVSGWDVVDLLDWLANFLLIIFAFVLVAMLRRDHDHGIELIGDRRARTLGGILAGSILFDPFNRILYLPLALVIGYLLFTRFLLLSPASSVARQLRHLRGRSRSHLVNNAVAAGMRLRGPSNSTKSPVPPEPATPDTGGGSLQSWRRTRATKEARWLGLAVGTSDSAWARASHLTLFSLLISLPWEVLYFILHGLGQTTDTRYTALIVLARIAFSLIQWPALGFLIGFFYPVIRGTSGLWKGLYLAITYIVPIAVFDIARALIGDNLSWGPELLWAAQVFVTCVTTGFYAEFRTLTDAGHSWKDLSALHNFRGLTAWGSSLVAAVTTAAITIAVSPLSQAVTSQFGGGDKPPAATQPNQPSSSEPP